MSTGQVMMLADLLTAKAVLAKVEATGKQQLLQTLAAQAATLGKLDAHQVFDMLWQREQLGTTGVGHGLAIPHGRVDGLTQVQGLFAQLATPLAFDADHPPVDLVFLLLAPAGAGADHLQALALVSKLLRDAKLCAALRQAKDAAALYRLLTDAAVAQAG